MRVLDHSLKSETSEFEVAVLGPPDRFWRCTSKETQLELIPITESGAPAKPLPSTPEVAAEVVEAMTQLYRAVGYEPPWIGYLAIETGDCVGTCGFKSPPQNNRVEIALHN